MEENPSQSPASGRGQQNDRDLDEFEERLGDLYSMTQREYNCCALVLLLALALVGGLYWLCVAARS